MTSTTSIDPVALSLAPFSWRRGIGDRLRAGEAAGVILQAIVPVSESEARVDRLLAQARRAVRRAERVGVRPIAWGESEYPPLLATIYDPPPVLWARGDARALMAPAVAIVGSRAGSPYALTVAARLAGDLAARGVTVVSGLARGVDAAAHRGALEVGGRTVGVLGSGTDVVYPPEHAALFEDIVVQGALVSELQPGTEPLPWFFPLRNRIISGLCRAVVVVEAGEKSGSLITARCALEQGRDVLAVPGSVLGERNRGGHALLRDGARIVESADDILEELKIDELKLSTPAQFGTTRPLQQSIDEVAHGEPDSPGFDDPVRRAVLKVLSSGEACDFDQISAGSGFPAAELLPRLLELELMGDVRRVAGGRFVRS